MAKPLYAMGFSGASSLTFGRFRPSSSVCSDERLPLAVVVSIIFTVTDPSAKASVPVPELSQLSDHWNSIGPSPYAARIVLVE